jgi:hypothetical protein
VLIRIVQKLTHSFRKPGDTANFSDYPDSDKISPEVSKKDDPFLDW